MRIVLPYLWLAVAACGGTKGPQLADAGTEGEGEAEGEDGGGGDACALVRCPPNQVCEAGACVRADPCAGVQCPEEDTVCSAGSCVSALVDEDHDGSPAADDCDDHDPDVEAGTSAPCSTECGDGTSTCQDATWQPCTAPTECDCTEGQTRQVDCGRCGTTTQSCGDDLRWGAAGACAGEGECSAGATEVEPCPVGGDCASRQRTCSVDCDWGAFGPCTSQTECDEGEEESRACGDCGSQTRDCSAQCLWGAYGACEDEGTCAPNDSEARGCGRCGTQSRTCDGSCAWGNWGVCGGEGVCDPGAVETTACGNCGTQTRTCNAGCGWGAWGACNGQGPCAPGSGETVACGGCGQQSRTCNFGCQWDPFGACNDPCGGPTLVGQFMVSSGPAWATNPPTYTCREACALLFGGTFDQYQCSTQAGAIDHLAYEDGWGDTTHCVAGGAVDEDYELSDTYDCGAVACSFSAYVNDHACNLTNYCWR